MFTILIVDDNTADREGIKNWIDWEELEVQVVGLAVNGMDGYKKAMEVRPDFILTDVAMPVMDGIKMTRKIKEELPDTKFIFMSCFDEFDFVKNAMNLEVAAYILKPVELDEITDAVQKIKKMREHEILKAQFEEETKNKLSESMPLLQEQFLKDLMHQKVDRDTNFLDKVKYLGIPYNQCFTIVMMQVDNFEIVFADKPVEQRYVVMHGIRQCIRESLLISGKGYIVTNHYNSLVVVLFIDVETVGDQIAWEGALEHIIEKTSECRESINQKLQVCVTIGIGDISDNLEDMPMIFQQAGAAIKSKFFSEGNRIIMASEVKPAKSILQYNFDDLKKEIRMFLEDEEPSEDVSFILQYFDSNKWCSQNEVKSLCFTIVTIVQTELIERNESFKNIFGDELIVWDKLTKFETIIDLKQWMKNILQSVKEHLASRESVRYNKIIEDIKSIINNKYAEIESIEQITSDLYISAGHASYIFKQQTGKTIFDYLVMKRMEAAKHLLSDPYYKIYEVSEKVGYKSKSYFASAFKEYTGLTPKQYRDKCSQ